MGKHCVQMLGSAVPGVARVPEPVPDFVDGKRQKMG